MVISRELERYVTDVSANCKQDMFTETAAQQDASSSIEKSVANVAFATRSQVKSPPTRSSVSGSLPVKLPPTPSRVRSAVQLKLKECSFPSPIWIETFTRNSRKRWSNSLEILVKECRNGFDQTGNWTIDDCKHVWKEGSTRFDLNVVPVKTFKNQYMMSVLRSLRRRKN